MRVFRRLLALVVTFGLLGATHLGSAQVKELFPHGLPPVDSRTLEPGKERKAEPKKPSLDAEGDALPDGAVARLGTARFRIGEYLRDADISHDGNLLIVGASRGIQVLDGKTGKYLRQIGPGFFSFRSLTLSPDFKTLAVSTYNNIIQLWDTDKGQAVRQLAANDRNMRFATLAYSGDGKMIAAAPEDFFRPGATNVVVFDATSGKEVVSVAVLPNRQVKVALNHDGKLLAVGGGHYNFGAGNPAGNAAATTVQLWDVKTGKEIKKLEDHPGMITAVAFSGDGKQLATISGMSAVSIWDVDSGKLLKRFAGRRGLGSVLKYSPDGKYLVACGSNGEVQVWETATWKRTDGSGPRCRLIGVAFPKDEKIVAYGMQGQAFRVWNPLTGKVFSGQSGHAHNIKNIIFSPDDRWLTTVDQTGRICVWDRTNGKEVKSFDLIDPENPVAAGTMVYNSITASPDGKYLAAYFNGSIRLWEKETMKIVCDFPSTNTSQNTVGFSPDSTMLAVMEQDATVAIWDISSGAEVRRLKMRKKVNNPANLNINGSSLTFSPRGKRLAAACYYYDPAVGRQIAEVCLWDAATGREVARFEHANYLPAMAFSPDGVLLAVAGQTGVHLYHAGSGRELRQLTPNQMRFNELTFSPDGRMIAGAALTNVYTPYQAVQKSTIYVWEVTTGTVRTQFTGQEGQVFALTFSGDSKLLASGGTDTSVLLWDVIGSKRQSAADRPTGDQLEMLWAELENLDGERSFRAMSRLIAFPDVSMSLIKKNLTPAKGAALTAEQIAKLVKDLDSPSFRIREKAFASLKDLGKRAYPELQKAFKSAGRSEELKQRIEKLLERLEEVPLSNRELREVRAVEVLERIGTPEAREHLAALAAGGPGNPLTEQAHAALERLKR